jgi:hypothetical protein
MPEVTVKVTGLSDVQNALKRLPVAVQTQMLDDALRAGGEVLRRGIVGRIHSRTGRTAEDVSVALFLKPSELAGLARIGGTVQKGGRAHVLNFLERGTKPHDIPKVAKKFKARRGASTIEQLRKFTAGAKKRKRLTVYGKVFSAVKHKGTHAQAPMRITIAQDGARTVHVFAQTLWNMIRAYCQRVNRPA